MAASAIRVLTWNLFHCRDGLPGLGPDLASTLWRRPRDDGSHLHLNRKHTLEMGAAIAALRPDLCALQEVPTAAIAPLAAATGMTPVWTTTGPLIGPTWLRDRLGAANPDLWRSHEGNANLLLVGPRLSLVEGSVRSMRLNPLGLIARTAWRLRLGPGEVLRWLVERRGLVAARIAGPGGERLTAACVHCHNARRRELNRLEIARAAAAVEAFAEGGPALLAGDLNAPASDPALSALAEAGWQGVARKPGIDRILQRGLEAVAPAETLPPREAEMPWRGERRLVRLSDHAPVLGVFRLPDPAREPGS